MAALYPGTSVSGYNSNPPPDDGTTGANNQITWSGVKSKLGDPLNVWAAAIDSNVTASFNKTLSGGSVVSTAVDYPATSADQGRNIVVTVSGKTVTTPDATVVHSPFVFCVNNQSSGNVTIAGFGGTQNIDGATTAKLGKGRGVILWTDGSNWFSSGFVMGNLPLANPPFGFDAPINLQLNASVGSSLLTIAVKSNDGTDPTTSNPVLIPFRDSTVTGGDPVWVAVTAALSINTNAVGATLGSANNNPFRFWVVALNNAGTVVLGLINCSTFAAGSSSATIFSLNEHAVQSTTAISAAATSAGVFYTPNGTTLSSKSFRIIGFVSYETALATAGTYGAAPDVVQLFGPGIRKPGDAVQTVHFFGASSTTSFTTLTATNVTASITPTSKANLVRYEAYFSTSNNTDTSVSVAQMYRGSTAIGPILRMMAAGVNGACPTAVVGIDAPYSTSALTYVIKGTAGSGTGSIPAAGNDGATEILTEIMG